MLIKFIFIDWYISWDQFNHHTFIDLTSI